MLCIPPGLSLRRRPLLALLTRHAVRIALWDASFLWARHTLSPSSYFIILHSLNLTFSIFVHLIHFQIWQILVDWLGQLRGLHQRLVFSSWTMIFLGVLFFGSLLFGVRETFSVCGYKVFDKVRKCSANISSSVFSHHLLPECRYTLC